MAICASCGHDVTGKKFCQQCGTPVQSTAIPAVSQAVPVSSTCPRCNETVNPGAAFCNHCGSSLSPQVITSTAATAQPTTIHCSVCQAEVPANNAFCTNCGHNMHEPIAPAIPFCTNCGHQNTPGVHFCANCGNQLGAPTPVAQPGYPAYTPQQQTYQAAYGQPQYPPQGQIGAGYQQQPMMGQQPMVLRCPVCMAMAPLGTTNCVSCHTSLAGVVPTHADIANMPQQGGMMGGLGGFMQGDGGKYAMGALGGAAALIGGEMLLHGVENSLGGRDDGYHHHGDNGLLGGLGEIANDLGL